jgi:maleate isomerase
MLASMWRRDGWGAVTRIGLLIPHADVGPESELQAMAPPSVVVHGARAFFGAMAPGGAMDPALPLEPVRAFADPPGIDAAVALLAAAPVHAIGYAFTSSAYLIGADGEAAMLTRLRERAGGIPVTASCTAAVEALRALGVGRLALVHPPWFDEELAAQGEAYFGAQGFEVVLSEAAGLPSDQRRIEPEPLYEWLRAHVPDRADGVFVGGNGFRAVGVIEAAEVALHRPVATANQCLLWHLLWLAGARERPSGYGRLLSEDGP